MTEKMQKPDVVKVLLKTADVLSALADCVRALCLALADDRQETVQKVPEIPLERVRGLLAEKSRNGYTAEVRSIIKSFGAERLSEIDPSDYEAVLMKAEALGNG